MKKLIFLISLLPVFTKTFSQALVKTGQLTEIKTSEKAGRAIFTPNDEAIIYWSQSNGGLFEYNLSTGQQRMLSTDIGAISDFYVGENSENVVYKTAVFDNYGRRQTSVILQNIISLQKTELVSAQRQVSTITLKNNQVFVICNKDLKSFEIGSNIKSASAASVAFTDNQLNLVLVQNNQYVKLNPLGDGNYIWVSMSPDGSKIVFNKTGKGTYICDLQGTILADLGRLHAPKWSADGKWIIGMDDYDDGHQYTMSKIVLCNSAGIIRQEIDLKENAIALYPDLSSDKKKIVFTDANGKLFLLQIDEME
jgi:hypothetical protein